MAGQDWDVSVPIDHSKISARPSQTRDLKGATKTIIQKEHVALGASNSGGQHLKGAARVYLDSALPSTDPESNNLDTSATSDDGRIAVATGGGVSTGLTNTIKVYIATSAGISTGWKDVRAGYAGTAVRVSLGKGINVVGQHNTGAETYINLIKVNANDVPEILVGAVLSADTAPSTGIGIPNRKYLLDQIAASADPAYSGGESHVFDGGLIFKMGTSTVGNTAIKDITYGTAFPTACLYGWAIDRLGDSLASQGPLGVGPKSGSEDTILQVENDNASGIRTFQWFAIGH